MQISRRLALTFTGLGLAAGSVFVAGPVTQADAATTTRTIASTTGAMAPGDCWHGGCWHHRHHHHHHRGGGGGGWNDNWGGGWNSDWNDWGGGWNGGGNWNFNSNWNGGWD
ncbi:MAG: hypothetical protein QOE54_5959 [Streptosporangiaceae bacterium]|nr:hypothetical protein [Streptosporangiaceae bacterium]